eukprot:Clim_evm16s213 gene=Clim_evmTU16s213
MGFAIDTSEPVHASAANEPKARNGTMGLLLSVLGDTVPFVWYLLGPDLYINYGESWIPAHIRQQQEQRGRNPQDQQPEMFPAVRFAAGPGPVNTGARSFTRLVGIVEFIRDMAVGGPLRRLFTGGFILLSILKRIQRADMTSWNGSLGLIEAMGFSGVSLPQALVEILKSVPQVPGFLVFFIPPLEMSVLLFGVLAFMTLLAWVGRGVSRSLHPMYQAFVADLKAAWVCLEMDLVNHERRKGKENKAGTSIENNLKGAPMSVNSRVALARLNAWDFAQWARPIDFDVVEDLRGSEPDLAKRLAARDYSGRTGSAADVQPEHTSGQPNIFYRTIYRIFANVLARPMLYPGSTRLLADGILADDLLRGRAFLFAKEASRVALAWTDVAERSIAEQDAKGADNKEEHRIVANVKPMGFNRCRIRTALGFDIDCAYLDRRKGATDHGSESDASRASTLCVTCEGNASFYEMSVMGTALRAGHSILAWNHAGYAGSGGQPNPSTERAAIEAVLYYAQHALDWDVGQIKVYAWSIGGFPAAHAANVFPDLHSVILDATFDSVVPLAVSKLPPSASSLTQGVLEEYFHLEVSSQLAKFPGPVLIVRRAFDEMMVTTPGDVKSNRSILLSTKFLLERYEDCLVEELMVDFMGCVNDQERQELQTSNKFDPKVGHKILEDLLDRPHDERGKGYGGNLLLGSSHDAKERKAKLTEEEKKQLTLHVCNLHTISYELGHTGDLPRWVDAWRG